MPAHQRIQGSPQQAHVMGSGYAAGSKQRVNINSQLPTLGGRQVKIVQGEGYTVELALRLKKCREVVTERGLARSGRSGDCHDCIARSQGLLDPGHSFGRLRSDKDIGTGQLGWKQALVESEMLLVHSRPMVFGGQST